MPGRDWFPTFHRWTAGRPWLPLTSDSWWPPVSTANQQQSLLRLLALAQEENLDVIPLLEAWGMDERGTQQRRLRQLVELLRNGRTLHEALEDIPGLVSQEGLLALRFDSQLGLRTATVRQELKDDSLVNIPAKGRRAFIYFCVLILLGLPIIAYLQMSIFPRMQKILFEFDMPLTGAMNRWNSFATVAGNFWWLILLAAVVTLFALVFRRRRKTSTTLSRLWTGWEAHPLAADVLQKLSLALRAGRPIASALSTLARYYFDPATWKRLLYVRNEVEQGVEPWQSLADVHFLNLDEVQLLNTAGKLGNQPLVLHLIAQSKKRRSRHHLQQWGEFLLPAVVLTVGAFILFLALAYFGPLVELVRTLGEASP